MPTVILNQRIIRPLLLFGFALSFVIFYLYVAYRPPIALYADLFEAETKESKALLHNEIGNKYVKFKQLQGAGFNNQAQEIMLYHHLALQTSRIYVYQPLIWRPRGEDATVPLSAFMRGLTEGAISESVFDEVCPPDEVQHVNLRIEDTDQWKHAIEILSRKHRCIVVDDKVFTWNFLSSSGIHAIWPGFQGYIRHHFKWSDNVLAIVNRTETTLNLRPQSAPDSAPGAPYIALHLRRGDFEDHCKFLAATHEGFTTWATLPLLQPAVLPPALDTYNATTVLAHCFPALRRVLGAISAHARARPHLRALHVLHDGAWDHPGVFLAFYKLAEALTNAPWAEAEGWTGGPMTSVTQSADVPVKRGEYDFAVCVDVELAARAEVFVGNGYSSLSTQVVALRLGRGGKVDDITLY
ncbi:hypothetical protein HYPSUDRAFT_142836 [Hypholoma sublateritium FD-334 SS-4]|uniref:Glycosyltransferase family 23 protein n=1 Tax=Hypholoma sublateritium (strain FD-334 SS-4) TaxID=945553 RepID=A0A0D2L033_HYPSF|nr:hypothetical protein HYPSUDRAFT_142836 [Hypholoma sublateritium FD-334 SS-4]